MDKSGELEPFLVRMLGSDPFRGLESVHRVREIDVRIRLVDHVVKLFQRLQDRRLEVIEFEPFLVLNGILFKVHVNLGKYTFSRFFCLL